MSLFGKKEKKEKKVCEICGNEIGFFSSTLLDDGSICDSCASKIEPALGPDMNFLSLSVEEAKNIIAGMHAEVDKIKASTGANAVFSVYHCSTITPKKTLVGIKNAKELNEAVSIRGYVSAGTFVSGDTVTVMAVDNSSSLEAQIYGVYEAIDNMSDQELIAAGSRKKGITENMQAYIVFQKESSQIPQGRIIIIKR